MKIHLELHEYSPDVGLRTEWDEGFMIETRLQGDIVLIRANRAGLVSLARHLLTLAQEEVPHGCHMHLDELNALEDGSCELILERA